MLPNQRKEQHAGLFFIRTVLFGILAALFASSVPSAHAQSGFINAWERRVNKTVSQQPAWPVPVATPPSGLVQLARFDAVRQITSTHTETWIYGNSKGGGGGPGGGAGGDST